MKRSILTSFLCLLAFCCPLLATTTVSGNLKDIGATNLTSGTFVRFWLRGTYGFQPRVNGTALIGPQQSGPACLGAAWCKDFIPDVSGNITGTVYSTRDASGNGNGEIETDSGVFTSTWYGVQLFVNGRGGPEVAVAAKLGATLNVTTVTPLTATPAVTAPTGDNVYLRLDGGNSPVTGNVQFNGNNTFTGSNTFSVWNQTYNASSCALSPAPSWCSGADMGAWINAAYAALPASGGTIFVSAPASGTCWNYSTPILFTTSGKFPLLKGLSAANGQVSVMGACLNYTPTTATIAITADYVPLTGSPTSGVHGIEDIMLVNNSCTTTAGCSSSATGLSDGTTNQGMYEGRLSNVSISGFGVGFSDLNNKSVDIYWSNPNLFSNTVGMNLLSPTGIFLNGGTIAGNGTAIKSSGAGATPSLDIIGVQFFGNPTAIFDFTASTLPGLLDCVDCHLENGSANNANAHFLTGVIDAHFTGGVAEDDSSVGTGDWMFNTGGNLLTIQGMMFKAVRTDTTIIAANSPTRGILGGMIGSANHFTNFVNGANAGKFAVELLAGPSSVTPNAFSYESLFSPTIEVGAGSGFIIDENGAPGPTAAKDTCYGSSSGVHGIRCDYNLDGNGFGSVPTVNRPWTWTALQTFNAGQISAGNGFVFDAVYGTYKLASDQVITAGASLAAIPGLNWTMPANTALNISFSCHLSYSQATAAASDSFGIQDVTVAPTNIYTKKTVYTSSSVLLSDNTPTLSTTTATAIGAAFTPSAATTIFNADIDGTIEQPSNASTSVVQIMAQFTTNNGTIKRGSFCRVW